MKLVIDLSNKEEVLLVLKKGRAILDESKFGGIYQLSEMLLGEIDAILKKNKIRIEDIKEIKIVPSKDSIVSNRIAKAMVLGLGK